LWERFFSFPIRNFPLSFDCKYRLCYDISEVLKSTRDAETVLDIIFLINMIISFVTINDALEIDHLKAKDLRPVFKEITIAYLK